MTYFIKSNGVTVNVEKGKGDAILSYAQVSTPKQLIEVGTNHSRVLLASIWERPKH